MNFWDRHLFGDSRPWACGRAAGDVLEVAVGTGRNLSYYPDGTRLTGVDWSPAMLGIARQRAAALGREADCARAMPRRWTFRASRSTPCCALSAYAPSPTTGAR
jgi:SAM-dependent methyltransferase